MTKDSRPHSAVALLPFGNPDTRSRRSLLQEYYITKKDSAVVKAKS